MPAYPFDIISITFSQTHEAPSLMDIHTCINALTIQQFQVSHPLTLLEAKDLKQVYTLAL